LEGRPPEVLVGAEVTVAPGGQPGTISIRAAYNGVNAVGPPVELPAVPGVHTFPAPHIRRDDRFGQIGFDQVTGSHAVLRQTASSPFTDPCDLTVLRPGEPTKT
jgi:hypothetical protein